MNLGIERKKMDENAYHIAEAGYDPFTKVIEVRREDGTIMQYQGPTNDHWKRIITSPCPAAHIHAIASNPASFDQREVKE